MKTWTWEKTRGLAYRMVSRDCPTFEYAAVVDDFGNLVIVAGWRTG
jgi:hypothetical protein